MEISDKLYERLLGLSKETLLKVMLNALDEMAYHNGQSSTRCICLALGAEEVDEDTRTVYRLPPTDAVENAYK